MHRDDAMALGVAVCAAAYSPPAVRQLLRLKSPPGGGYRPGQIEQWCAGGCCVFAVALALWLNVAPQRRRARGALPPPPKWVQIGSRGDAPPRLALAARRFVLEMRARERPLRASTVALEQRRPEWPDEPALVHAMVSFGGWLFDDRGAWEPSAVVSMYGGTFDGLRVVPYVAGRYAGDGCPRGAREVEALRGVFRSHLGDDWRRWVVPAQDRRLGAPLLAASRRVEDDRGDTRLTLRAPGGGRRATLQRREPSRRRSRP